MEDSSVGGTVGYMAPEVLQGEKPSAKSDLYAVGVIFHQLLTGSLPEPRESLTSLASGLFGADTDATLSPDAAAFLSGLPSRSAPRNGALAAGQPPQEPMNIPDALAPIVGKLLQRDPAERYESASAALHDLAAVVPYELPAETAATRESFLQATTLIGRAAELSILVQALKQTETNYGSAILIGGESGVGKSRLLAELRTLALVHGFGVAQGQSVSEDGYHYHEWLPLLRALCFQVDFTDTEASVLKELLPEIPTLLQRPVCDPHRLKPEAAVDRLAQTLTSLLKRLAKPLLFMVEDLHWGRSESLALLAAVAKAVPRLPLLVVGTYRSDERPELPQALPDYQVLALKRLPPHDVAVLSESMLGPVGSNPNLVDYLVAQTEGNVFFLVETVRALAENAGELDRIDRRDLQETAVPVGIERIVERRVDHVAASYRPLLELAATLGRQLDLAVLRHVFPEAPVHDFLIDCANAALLESQGSDWRFAHDKLRETILRRLAADRRRQLHLQAAQALERLHAGPAREALAAVLGYHYRLAGVPEQAVRYYLQAGDRAIKIYAFEQARAHHATAAELVGSLPPTPEVQRLHIDILTKQVGSSLLWTVQDTSFGRIAKARQLLESLHGAGDVSPDDRLRLGRIDYSAARLHDYAGQMAQAVAFYQRVLPIGREFQDPELMIVPAVFLGRVMTLRGHNAKAKDLLAPVLVPMEQHFGKDIETLRSYMHLFQAMASMGQYESGLRLVAYVKPWVAQEQQPFYAAAFHAMLAMGMHFAGDWPAVLAASRQAIELAGTDNEPLMQYMSWDLHALAQNKLDDLDGALDSRNRALALRRLHGGGYLKEMFEAGDAERHLKAGRAEEAAALARAIAETTRASGFLRTLVVAERLLGCALARLGAETKDVTAHFQASLEAGTSCELVMEVLTTQLAWAATCAARGEHQASALHYRQAEQRLTAEMSPYARAAALRQIAERATDLRE